MIDWVWVGWITDKFGVRYEFWELASSIRTLYEARFAGVRIAGVCLTPPTQEVWVHKELMRRGIASAMYNFIEDRHGIKLKPGRLTPDGIKFWEARKNAENFTGV